MVKLNRHVGNWADCLAEMGNKERPVTVREGMLERIKQGIDAPISRGSWFPENFNYIQEKVLVASQKYNPQIPYAERAIDANKSGRYLQLTPDIKLEGKPASQLLLEIAEEDAKKPASKRRVLDSTKKSTFTIQSKKLGEEEIAIFLARGEELAKEYGEFISGAGIPEVTFYLANQGKEDFSAGFWLRRVGRGYWSGFNGGNRALDDGGGCLFGVRRSAEGTSQKIATPSLTEILRFSKPFVPQAVRKEFEKGLRERYQKQ